MFARLSQAILYLAGYPEQSDLETAKDAIETPVEASAPIPTVGDTVTIDVAEKSLEIKTSESLEPSDATLELKRKFSSSNLASPVSSPSSPKRVKNVVEESALIPAAPLLSVSPEVATIESKVSTPKWHHALHENQEDHDDDNFAK